MKEIAETSPILASPNMQSSVMGIDAANFGRITKFLRDSIYSDKILAVIREAVTNAIDEHIKFNVSLAVKTGVRNVDGQHEFFVRDFAMGLSEDGIRNIFGMYGASTKRSDNNQVGGFGVGAKSFMSYTDSAFVISHYNGEKTTYSCALGGDENNVSVGHIFKMASEPTTESGLEIVVPVQSKDVYSFISRIKKFVQLSPHNIIANLNGEICEPLKPTSQKKIGRFNVRSLEFDGESSCLILQMGGVSYKDYNFTGEYGSRPIHTLVVDIPIGDCSVTLSREGFEDTERNRAVFDEINSMLSDLSKEELAPFASKTFEELLGDLMSEMRQVKGDFFLASHQNLYSDWNLIRGIRKVGEGDLIQKGGKPVLFRIPDTRFSSQWVDKVFRHCKKEGKSAYYLHCSHDIPQSAINYFAAVSAKAINDETTQRKAGDKDSQVYAVYQRKNGCIGSYNDLGYFNLISQKRGWKIQANTREEAANFLKDKFAKCNDIQELRGMALVSSSDSYYPFSIKSRKLIDNLVELGFVEKTSQAYQSKIDEIRAESNKQQEKDKLIQKAKKKWLITSPRTKDALRKPRHAERFSIAFNKIKEEKSLRGKMLATFETCSYYSGDFQKIERAELRKILKTL